MEWIFIAPHLDDVVLSCGGLLWELNRQGDSTSVWTICAGDPPEGPLSSLAEALHQRWGTGRRAARLRRQEDILACERLGAAHRHFPVPDCIYRCDPTNHAPLYRWEKDIFGPLAQADEALIERLSVDLQAEFKPPYRIVSPLAIGGHVDHRLVRQALEKTSFSLWYYADYPYVLQNEAALENLRPAGWQPHLFAVSQGGVNAWVDGVAAYSSQISTFWEDEDDMRAAIQDYWRRKRGIYLWGPPEK